MLIGAGAHCDGGSAEEFREVKAAEIEFTRLDRDQDGKVSREEWIAKYGSDEGFDAYDLDGDGIIDGEC